MSSRPTFLLIFSLLLSGCGSSYLVNRRRDLADIVTLTGGYGAGAKVRLGVLSAGLKIHKDKIGLRGGTFANAIGKRESLSEEYKILIVGPDRFHGDGDSSALLKEREKEHEVFNILVPWGYFNRGRKNRLSSNIHWTYWTQIEVAVAAGPGLRVGVNFGEFFDFLAGIVGIDLFMDDVAGN